MVSGYMASKINTNLTVSCVGLRRHSFSAPARLSLERLELATQSLGVRVASLSSLVSAQSEQSKDLVDIVTMRTCHGCHAPIDGDHKGFPTGADQCPLEHWSGCKEVIPEGASGWRPCPADSVPGSEAEDSEKDETSDELHKDDLSYLKEVSEGDGLDSSSKQQIQPGSSDHEQHQKTGAESPKEIVEIETDEDDEKVLRELESANALLKSQKAKVEAERIEKEKREKKEKIKLLKAENEKLSLAMGGDIGGSKVKNYKSANTTPKQISGTKFLPHPKSVGSELGLKKNSVDKQSRDTVHWQPEFQRHLSRNQSKAAQYTPGEDLLYDGIDINGIRKIPEVSAEVEKILGVIQRKVPSLDSRPSLKPGQSLPAPDIPLHRDDDVEAVQEFVFYREPNGTLKKVKVVAEHTALSRPGVEILTREPTEQLDDPDTSSDEDCDIVPQPGYRLRWKRDIAGTKYNIEEKISKPNPAMVYKYVRDASGRSYKKLVPAENPARDLEYKWVIDAETGHRVQMLVMQSPVKTKSHALTKPTQFIDYRTASSLLENHPQRGSKPSQSSNFERGPGFITVTGSSADEKQSKGNIPDIVKYARDCPVAWTTKVTTDKLNLGLWCWSYMAQLLATRTGQAPSLGQGELEAKMQHFLNVLEIALQPSNPTEFDGHSWRVARLYAEKIQNKIDRGETWAKFDEKYGTDSQPSELMAAREELGPKQPPRRVKVKEEERKQETNRGSRRLCTTWNTSSIEGKCDWEVQNEGKSCDRRHDCSWCKENGKRSLFHQRSFCRQRIAAEGQ